MSRSNWKRKVPQAVLDAVVLKARKRCEWCQSNDQCGIDHIYPKGQGGPHKIWNFQYLCNRCGNWKCHDLPRNVVFRIHRLRVTSRWSASVKQHGLRMMEEFIRNGNRREEFAMDVERGVSECSQELLSGISVFPNPLEVNLGEGRILMSCFTDTSDIGVKSHGLLLSFHDGSSHEIGEQTENRTKTGSSEGEVYIRCFNKRSALVLLGRVQNLVARFAADEAAVVPLSEIVPNDDCE